MTLMKAIFQNYSSTKFYGIFLQPCIVIVPSVEDVVSGNKWPIHIFSIVDDMSALLYNLLHLFFHNCNHSCLFGPQWKYTLVKARA